MAVIFFCNFANRFNNSNLFLEYCMTRQDQSKASSGQAIYQHDVLEFVQVAVQFCSQLEQAREQSRQELTGTLLKLMPLMYLKAQLLPKVESSGSFLPDEQVTEQDYEFIRLGIHDVLGSDDEYMDVAYDEMMQTDETRWKSISENLADIYQPVRNFLSTYQQGIEDCMFDALWEIQDQFELYWGEALVDSLRRLHRLQYAVRENGDTESYAF